MEVQNCEAVDFLNLDWVVVSSDALQDAKIRRSLTRQTVMKSQPDETLVAGHLF
jgi:hypothetical protein